MTRLLEKIRASGKQATSFDWLQESPGREEFEAHFEELWVRFEPYADLSFPKKAAEDLYARYW